MLPKPRILVAISLFSLTLAAPNPVMPAPRCGTTMYPAAFRPIDSTKPKNVFPETNVFKVSQTADGVSNVDSLVRFSRPGSSYYGCSLGVTFPKNWPITSFGDARLNVYALPNDIAKGHNNSLTYFPSGVNRNHAVKRKTVSLWGTVTLNSNPGSGQIKPNAVIINSEVCGPTMSFLFEIASDTAASSVGFTQSSINGSPLAGFFLTYHC
ncbi:MAG: hypothetical protein M1834_000006 [Cirrosporium novae-zelandiae]|nr:MAG: hypothetical protein M1834_000006 [Cirrosporium novae-zelandiae]